MGYGPGALGLLLYLAVLLLFATWTTCHVLLCLRLAGGRTRQFRLQALLGFFVPPVAPYCGLKVGLKKLSYFWGASALLYLAALLLAVLSDGRGIQ